MSYYNDLHAGTIPGTEEESEVKALTGHRGESGIQNHSCGPLYPWVWTCVENRSTGTGQYYYKHPDGRVSPKAVYNLDANDATKRNAYRAAEAAVQAIIDQDSANEREEAERLQRKPRRFNLGEKLPNGATVLQQQGVVVLAAKTWHRDGHVVEYVTWLVDKDGNASAGHYFPAPGLHAGGQVEFCKACDDFIARCNTWHGQEG